MNLQIAFCLLVLGIGNGVAEAKKFPLVAGSNVPAARGEVNAHRDDNGNTEVKLEVEHLAKPENLTPPKTSYTVWFQERGSDPVNQGQLRVNSKLKADFRTVTPMRSFDLLVTAESDPLAKVPAGVEVLRASVQP